MPQFRERGIDEVWCVSVNDGYVMAAWGREAHAMGKIRMLGDGSAELTRKLGLEVDIPGMGQRMKRCAMLVENGVLKHAPQFAVGPDATMTLTKGALTRVQLGQLTLKDAIEAGDIKVDGRKEAVGEFFGMLDNFDFWFNVVTP